MKLSALLEGRAELIPRDPTKEAAVNIARQLIQKAQYEAGGKPKATRELAQKMADGLHSNIAAAIDAELNFSQMKTVDEVA